MEKTKVVSIEGKKIQITHPNKVLFPAIHLTKWEWILGLTQLAPYLLPYTKNRLLTTIRWPHGVGGDFFYQKNAPSHAPEWIHTFSLGKINYLLLQDTPTLVWLANLSCLEFHLSFDRIDALGYPTELVFDLDPSVEGFEPVVETAYLLRKVIQDLELDGVVKTSGATGLQIYIPIIPQYTFYETRLVLRFIATYIAKKAPHLVTVERKVAMRKEKVYIDYLQHWQGKSLIAPYSTRARPLAPVSTPLDWEELTFAQPPDRFTIHTVPARLASQKDPFEGITQANNDFSLDSIIQFIRKYF